VRRSLRTRFAIISLASLAAACATFETRGDRAYDGTRVYSGTSTSLSRVGSGLINSNYALVFIGFADLPFSFVADTVLLPLTVVEETRRQKEVEDREQVEREMTTGVRSMRGESSVAAAERLFAQCADLLEQLDPRLADCYSIDARIVVVDPADPSRSEELRGAAYKEELRRALRRARASGDYFTYRETSYEPESSSQVRVRTSRARAASATRASITFLLGPGSDGEWRILEERGPGWP
jgi:uncharacterized protein YceK